MKQTLLILLSTCISQLTLAKEINVVSERPDNFVNLHDIIPQIQIDIRYASVHNFVGRRIKGYKMPICLFTKQATQALKKPEQELLAMGLTFKVYDCYRPITAVDDFAQWADDTKNTKTQAEFYPNQNKSTLFKNGYISFYSAHSRGSTLDLTIVPLGSKITPYKNQFQTSCEAPQNQRFPDNSLDFGTSFDCLSELSHPENKTLSPQVRANRLLLRNLMINAGFKPLSTEWWHFSLVNEPYPNLYFDFPVK